MFNWFLLVLLSPFLLLVIGFCVVVVVALCQAEAKDVPAVLASCNAVFRRLVEQMPRTKAMRNDRLPAPSDPDNTLDHDACEEAP